MQLLFTLQISIKIPSVKETVYKIFSHFLASSWTFLRVRSPLQNGYFRAYSLYYFQPSSILVQYTFVSFVSVRLETTLVICFLFEILVSRDSD
jgi:hypothetical protein